MKLFLGGWFKDGLVGGFVDKALFCLLDRR